VQRLGSIVGHLGLERCEHALSTLDQHHARLLGPDAAEVVAEGDPCQFDDRTREFDAGRAAADDGKGEQGLASGRVGFALGLLERHEQPMTNGGGIFQGLETRGEGLPVVMPEIGVAGPGGEDQVIVGNARPVLERDGAVSFIDTGDGSEQRLHIVAPLHELADRPGNLRRSEGARRHLVEERLEQVVVAPVDQRYGGTRAAQRLDGRKAAKSAADDDDPWLGPSHDDLRRSRPGWDVSLQ
jgi:hypothetical protein